MDGSDFTRRDHLVEAYRRIRSATGALCEPLEPEDCVVQTMPDVSPAKWHLAHTTWFFETFILLRARPGYSRMNEGYEYLFNSYYNAVGRQFPRPHRGLLSRPTVDEILDYRRHVDGEMTRFLSDAPDRVLGEHWQTIEVGLNHEEQHQELILTDIKHVLSVNPLEPAYHPGPAPPRGGRPTATPPEWIPFDGGRVEVGAGRAGFSFDNERPRHEVLLPPFQLADRPVSCGEYLAFMADRGYERPALWLSDGWDARRRHEWEAPLYWRRDGDGWRQMTLAGPRAIEPDEPVCHVSYYEADAYARWAGARLPREEEWEHAATGAGSGGNFVESGRLHPAPAPREMAGDEGRGVPRQMLGDVWEWTSSAYSPYPGYDPFAGDLGEYNGKFMVNQLVLRGGSCATPGRHIRPTYRNFFYPDARWQFSGIRLSR